MSTASSASPAHRWLKSYPANINWNAPLPQLPLFALLGDAERRYADKIAIDFLGKTFTYRELAESVRRLAAGLQAAGVGPGVNVGLFMPNCPQFVISYYAILKTGATVVNYNPLYSSPEIIHQINDSSTEVMVTLALNALYPKVAQALEASRLRAVIVSEFQEALPLHKRMAFQLARKKDIAHPPQDARHMSFRKLMESGHEFVQPRIHPDSHVAVLQYTGGTTGVPKGAVLTHANLYANTLQCGLWFKGLEFGREIIVGALPLFHVFSMTTVMNLALHTGSCMLLHPRFDLKALLHDIQTKKPTLMPGVPTMFAAINSFRAIDAYDLSSLKMGISGGGPLPMEVKSTFEKRTGCTLVEGYGLSESSPVAAANPLFGVNKAGSIGIPFPSTVMRICDMDDPHKILGAGETGEICISGPQVMRGYLHQFDENRKVLRNGFLHTGDLGYMDSDGYFFVVDRIKEMIISGGYKIYPRNIEEIVYQHPSVQEAACIGVHHPSRVQEAKLFIVAKEGHKLDEADIKAHLQGKVSAYAMPHVVEFRTSLPKSAIGKILKKILVEEENKKRQG